MQDGFPEKDGGGGYGSESYRNTSMRWGFSMRELHEKTRTIT